MENLLETFKVNAKAEITAFEDKIEQLTSTKNALEHENADLRRQLKEAQDELGSRQVGLDLINNVVRTVVEAETPAVMQDLSAKWKKVGEEGGSGSEVTPQDSMNTPTSSLPPPVFASATGTDNLGASNNQGVLNNEVTLPKALRSGRLLPIQPPSTSAPNVNEEDGRAGGSSSTAGQGPNAAVKRNVPHPDPPGISTRSKAIKRSKRGMKNYKFYVPHGPTKRGAGRFNCICSSSLSTKQGLQVHIDYFTKKSTMQCESCPRVFHTESLLNLHVKRNHKK